MFRTLLTPLVARFDISPRNPPPDLPQTAEDDNEIDPEEFARDVMVELMRNSVENLKFAEDGKVQVQVLTEIQRIMAQDAHTKGIFRELDGFLILMSLLSTIQDRQSNNGPVVEPEGQLLSEVLEITNLIFLNLDEAMCGNSQNSEYFQNTVTYASLSSSLLGLLSNPRATDHTLGLLLALSLHDFSLSPTFSSLRTVSSGDLDFQISKLEPTLKGLTIQRPEAILILWNSVQAVAVPAEDRVLCYATYKLFEMLSKTSHRNLAVLSSLEGLVGSVLERFWETRSDPKGGDDMGEGKGKEKDIEGENKGGKNKSAQDKERHVLQKLLRRLLDMGAGTKEARTIFQRAIKENGEDGLDAEMLDLLRFGMKSRWLEHFSLEGENAALVLEEADGVKGLPATGFTFMMWLWISSIPTAKYPLFTIHLSPSATSTPNSKARAEHANKTVVSLLLRPDGSLEFASTANRDPVVFNKTKFQRSRWTHVALVHYPHRNSNPSIRLFIDGVLLDSVNWSYPKLDWKDAQLKMNYVVGDPEGGAKMSWCLASAHLFSSPFGDDIPRFIHHLGARYTSNFQDPALVKFLTYEASTSLNMFLSTVAAQHSGQRHPQSSSALMKIVQNGLNIPENAIMFSVSAVNTEDAGLATSVPSNSASGSAAGGEKRIFKVQGDVFAVKARCLDMALWKVGGAAVALRLVQVANSQHELSRALGVLTDGLRNSWQNSEDMERLHGYDILGNILRCKSQMINITGFETLFEFLGMNFRTPEQSAVVNTIAYRAIALDFELWSQARKEIQQIYLEHFVTLLETSRYRKFNSRQRLAKMDLVRKLLFALQTNWYDDTMVGSLMEALKAAMQANFAKEETIKPVVTYIAANLHQESKGAASPRSTISRLDYVHPREKAEQVLDLLISLLSMQSFHTKFAAALPLTRICLLLLGDKPSSLVANRILTLIGISNTFTSSFSRKFELVSGWSVLKTVLPYNWDQSVNQAAFDIMLGRYSHVLDKSLKKGMDEDGNVVVCSNILPAILAALSHGLADVAKGLEGGQLDVSSSPFSPTTESSMESLVEQLVDLHASSSTFRQIFKSQQTTQIFVDGFKAFVDQVSSASGINQPVRRILEKIIHLGLAISLDPAIAGGQKREILDSVQKGDALLNPTSDKLSIDPSLIEDTRTVRQRIASARFSIHVSERTIIKTISRMQDWRKTIEVSEKKRLRKTLLDLRETRRQVSTMYDWTHILTSERGLWPSHETRMWRLDETEGPYRVRKKLEPQNDEASPSRVDGQNEDTRKIIEPEADTTSLHQVEVPPWAEGYEISSTEADDKLAEEVSDDKHRRIRHELEPGDVIEAVSTVARIVGVDSSPGLLIIGRTHIYILDGLVENDDGVVVEAHDAPKRLFFVPGSIVELDGLQRAQRWHHEQISSYSERTFLFRDVALEVYFKDSRSLLVTFLDKKKRADVDQRLSGILHRHNADTVVTPGLPRTPMFGTKSMSGWRSDQLSTAQRKWQAREISNFTYLCILNQISGRTPSDATQYPVFPWVIADYTSQTLDLLSADTFRDLTKPMGALTQPRKDAAEMRYTNLESVDEEPFHYGTHFSSSMIVCHYLIRLAPFTHMFKTLQGGDWDLPDRLFSDISRAYESASSDVRGDVRELIPEFYTCPEFLENAANLDFGVQQNTGERIHDVKLPPWARNDPLLFIVMNRRALESAHVSEHLPAWIDLIWGCKQRDPAALNVFHPLSYEGSIDLDTITDELEREAKVGIIHNFGQTPRKLFDTPHPERNNHGLPSLPLGTLHGIEEDPHLLLQGARCFKDLSPDTPVRELAVDIVGSKIIPCPAGVLTVPTHPHEQIEWKEKGSELRVLVDHKVVQVVENACCTCAAFADGHTLVTGSSDFTVRLWKLTRSSGAFASPTRVALSHIMRIHTDKVICVTASRTWSMVVSGSNDGSAALWDLNRGVYVRSIWHASDGVADDMTAVNLVAINESTGHIATCSRSTLYLHTINARPIAKLDLTTTPSYSRLVPTITALAFHEREYSPLGVLATGGADGTITLRTWTADGTPEGEKAQWEFVTIRTMKARMVGRGVTRPPSVTALRFSGETMIHGEETGKSYVWSLPDS